MNTPSLHNFHIPVMGLAYTIDTPIKVARFGINSVISIIEDKLIELMRKHYYNKLNLKYNAITTNDIDYRARRITDYLNLVNNIVKSQFESLINNAWIEGSEISQYFEMLPTNNLLRIVYQRLMSADTNEEKDSLSKFLKGHIRPGRIDVNIMTKVDKNNHDRDGKLVPDSSDALSALRGYAKSTLTNSAIIFSAGLNPRLFNYLESLRGFEATAPGQFNKKIVIKVSDYRSALIQGKYLAKKGIWVSEFRVESGLNCGGHAFATDGSLVGPILQEFKDKREELLSTLHQLYDASLRSKNIKSFDEPHPIDITVQGGVGTFEESQFLQAKYGVSSVGWGTPFLLCPEATTVDNETLELLCGAKEHDVVLSKNSPLGVRFNYLKGTSAEKEKLSRIEKGKPGSPCTEKHLVSNTEFTKEPICTASHAYQKRKIEQLKQMDLSIVEYERQFNDIVSKECLCLGLSNAAIVNYNLPPVKNLTAVTVCPGPNIAYFDKVVTLKEMADHIYGRVNILSREGRPHMFIKELELNVEYFKEQTDDLKDVEIKQMKSMVEFGKKLLEGIEYYRRITNESITKEFETQLCQNETEIKGILQRVMERFEPEPTIL